jgi:hypothetical protein
MSATIDIVRYTGASGSPTITVITNQNTRANAEDSATSTTSNPVQIPASGTNYSYWVATRLSAVSLPTTQIVNLRWYAPDSNNFGTGIGCNGGDASTYVRATGTQGTTGDPLNTTFYASGGLGTVDNVFLHPSGTPRNINGQLLSGGSVGPFGYFFVYQITVGNTANPGQTGACTFTWKYDET